MIDAFIEGVTQAPLPCSWTVLFAAITFGLSRPSRAATVVFLIVTALAGGLAGAGIAPPFWVAGVGLVITAVNWWRNRSAEVVQVGLPLALSAAWIWQPCVGPALGDALNTAQRGEAAGSAAVAIFVIGIVLVGLTVGIIGGRLIARPMWPVGAGLAALLGVAVLSDTYTVLVSVFARWSVALWA